MRRFLMIIWCARSTLFSIYHGSTQNSRRTMQPSAGLRLIPAFFAYADNYLIDVKFGIIMDVEASRAIRKLPRISTAPHHPRRQRASANKRYAGMPGVPRRFLRGTLRRELSLSARINCQERKLEF